MCVVGLDIGALILFRVWVNMEVNSLGALAKFFLGSICTTLTNAVCMMIMTQVKDICLESLNIYLNKK
jgi:hypothetical protein